MPRARPCRGTRTTVYLSHMGGGRRLRPRRSSKPRHRAAAVQPRRLDPGRLDPDRGRRSCRPTTRGDGPVRPRRSQDIPVGSIPRREHLREPRLRGRGGAGRRRRRGGLLHDRRARLQRLVTARRRSSCASKQTRRRRCFRPARPRGPDARRVRRARCPAPAARHEDALPRQPPAHDALYGRHATDAHARRSLGARRAARGRGQVLTVDGNAAVRRRTRPGTRTPCSVDGGEHGRPLDQRRRRPTLSATASPSLRYVVLLGSDDALPMARVPDPRQRLARDRRGRRPAVHDARPDERQRALHRRRAQATS